MRYNSRRTVPHSSKHKILADHHRGPILGRVVGRICRLVQSNVSAAPPDCFASLRYRVLGSKKMLRQQLACGRLKTARLQQVQILVVASDEFFQVYHAVMVEIEAVEKKFDVLILDANVPSLSTNVSGK